MYSSSDHRIIDLTALPNTSLPQLIQETEFSKGKVADPRPESRL